MIYINLVVLDPAKKGQKLHSQPTCNGRAQIRTTIHMSSYGHLLIFYNFACVGMIGRARNTQSAHPAAVPPSERSCDQNTALSTATRGRPSEWSVWPVDRPVFRSLTQPLQPQALR